MVTKLCPRCAGTILYINGDNDLECICGNVVYPFRDPLDIPENPYVHNGQNPKWARYKETTLPSVRNKR